MLDNLNPKEVFRIFEDICAIPHPSGKLDMICSYIENYAEKLGLPHLRDAANNIIIKKPGKGEMLAFQAHTDMVCEKQAEKSIDFNTQPIDLRLSGDTIFADGTTLGADNGIGVAMCLALLKADISLPLEIILTADEETGLMGAAALNGENIAAKKIINLDSEEEGVITVGCANGIISNIALKTEMENCSGMLFTVKIAGLHGGHSGTDISLPHQNAIKLLAEMLCKLPLGIRLASFSGGSRHSAIPRSAAAEFIVPITELKATKYTLQKLIAEFISKNRNDEPKISICFDLKETEKAAASLSESEKILSLISEFPHGVHTQSPYIEGLTESSLNLAQAQFCGNLIITAMVRSSDDSKSQEICEKIKALANKYNAKYSEEFLFPAWEYRKGSKLQGICENSFKSLFGKSPRVEIIHAGLECGVISQKTGAECVSIGPNMKNVHTAEEQLSVSSTERTYEYILEIIKEIEAAN